MKRFKFRILLLLSKSLFKIMKQFYKKHQLNFDIRILNRNHIRENEFLQYFKLCLAINFRVTLRIIQEPHLQRITSLCIEQFNKTNQNKISNFNLNNRKMHSDKFFTLQARSKSRTVTIMRKCLLCLKANSIFLKFQKLMKNHFQSISQNKPLDKTFL